MDASPFQVSCIDSILQHNPSINSHGTKLLSPRPWNSEAFSCCGCVLPWGNHCAVSPDRDIFTQLQHYITPAFRSSCSLDQLVFPFPLNGTSEADTPRLNSAMGVFFALAFKSLVRWPYLQCLKSNQSPLLALHIQRGTLRLLQMLLWGGGWIEYYKPLLHV